jgi:hypothetical protein
MHQTTLGATRLLARPGDRRLWLLDTNAAALWDLQAAGWGPKPLAGLLAERFALAPDAADAYVDGLQAHWRAAGLLADEEDLGWRYFPAEALPPLPPPEAASPSPGAWRLSVADRAIYFVIQDEALGAILAPLLAPLRGLDRAENPVQTPDRLVLHGDAEHWTLTANGLELKSGQGQDAALVATLSTLTELGCRTRERLLVAHGAGLVAPDGRGLLLIAPGGSGKSTLTTALNGAGFGLLSDDVVPVTPVGDLLGLGLPLCLKSGSWSVLSHCRPDLAQAATVQRFSQSVRFLPSHGRPVTGAVKAALFLFPRFRPGEAPSVEPLTPERALQGLVEAEAVIRDLDQAKLEALARWVSATPAYALSYPDLDRGLALVRDRLAELA